MPLENALWLLLGEVTKCSVSNMEVGVHRDHGLEKLTQSTDDRTDVGMAKGGRGSLKTTF